MEDRLGVLEAVGREVGDCLARDVADAHAQRDRVDVAADDDVAALLALLSVAVVEVQRVVVHRHQAEEVVIALRDRLAGDVLVGRAQLELFEVAPEAAPSRIASRLRRSKVVPVLSAVSATVSPLLFFDHLGDQLDHAAFAADLDLAVVVSLDPLGHSLAWIDDVVEVLAHDQQLDHRRGTVESFETSGPGKVKPVLLVVALCLQVDVDDQCQRRERRHRFDETLSGLFELMLCVDLCLIAQP